MSSFEDDIISMVKDMLKKHEDILTYAGTVSEVTSTPKPKVSVIVDGAQSATPCVPLTHRNWVAGQRVVIMRAGGTWYTVGILGFQTVLSAPRYTSTHPTGTSAGDVWYRDDLNHFYGNVNGTPTQLDN